MPYNTSKPSLGQIELFNHLLYLKPFNCVQTNKFWFVKNVTYKLYIQIIYILEI